MTCRRSGQAQHLRHACGRQADRLVALSLDHRHAGRVRIGHHPCRHRGVERKEVAHWILHAPDARHDRRGSPAAPRHRSTRWRRGPAGAQGRRWTTPARPVPRRRRCRSRRRRPAVWRDRPRAARRPGGRAPPPWPPRGRRGTPRAPWPPATRAGRRRSTRRGSRGGGPDRTGHASCRTGGRPCPGSRGRGGRPARRTRCSCRSRLRRGRSAGPQGCQGPGARRPVAPRRLRARPTSPSVPEVPRAGHQHRGPRAVHQLEHLRVTHGAAGLDDGGHAGVEQHLRTVREREERI